jgi:CRP-like cAMP-binding protein
MTPTNDPLRLRLTSTPGITRDHIGAVERLQSLGIASIVQAHATLEEESEPPTALYVIRRGWAFASKLLPDGARQVLGFLVAGDLIGGASAFLKATPQTVETICETVLIEIPVDVARRTVRQSPTLAEALMVLQAGERLDLSERLVDLGRRDGPVRVARLLLELWRRLFAVGIATPTGYACPLSQYLIADATGLTPIHVNRVLRELREGGLLTFRHGYVKFHDFDRLAQLTGFETPGRGRSFRRHAEEKGAA